MTDRPAWMLLHKSDAPKPLSALPDPFFERYRNPEGYDPDDDLVAAVNVALLLGQPLLITGEPGSGKTSLAFWLAHQVQLGEPLIEVVKSGTAAKDLLYRFDELARFRDANPGGDQGRSIETYIEFGALGAAILMSADPEKPLTFDRQSGAARAANNGLKTYADLQRLVAGAQGQRRVVLIDELDKAPRDTPNDLLSEIEKMEFRIVELGVTIRGDKALRPIVVITSNADKSFPEPFLRRCVYHHIRPLKRERRIEIVSKRRPALPSRPRLFEDAQHCFEAVRAALERRGRPPGTAEFLAWLDVVDRLYGAHCERMSEDSRALEVSLGVLAKNSEDLAVARRAAGLS